MVDHVATYVETIAAEVAKFDEPSEVTMKPEVRITLNEEMAMFGTVDFLATGMMNGTPTGLIVDLKYGKGIQVVAEGNPQLAYYAVALRRTSKKRLEQVHVVIVQPRIEQYYTSALFRSDDLDNWHGVLTRGAEKAFWQMALKKYEYVAGEHCRWCPAKGICGTHEQYLVDQAALDFRELPMLPDPTNLTPERMAKILAISEELTNFLEAVKANALALLQKGVNIPGYKIVPRRTFRRWTDEQAAAREISANGGNPYLPPKIKSVAMIEKEKQLKKVSHLVEKPVGGPTIAKESDKRESLMISDFDL